MFTNIMSAMMLTLLLATAGFSAEPSKPAPQANVAAPAPSSATATSPAATVAAPAAAAPSTVPASGVPTKVRPNRAITITMFLAIIGITLGVVVWAARQTKSAADFYAAGGGITGLGAVRNERMSPSVNLPALRHGSAITSKIAMNENIGPTAYMKPSMPYSEIRPDMPRKEAADI